MEQSKTDKAIVHMARKMNEQIPDRIRNAPVLSAGLRFFYQAFLDLSTCRPLGMAEGPIPWTAINTYAERHELLDDDYDRFLTLIRALDLKYLDYRDKKRATKEKQAAAKAKRDTK